MSRNRILRITAAVLLLAAVARVLAPHATSYVSSSAVVNAPLSALRSPVDGRIADASPEIAAPIRPGETLLRVEAERESRSLLQELEARRAVIDAELEAAAERRSILVALADSLERREKVHGEQASLWLSIRMRETEAGIRAREAALREIRDRLGRARKLADAGSMAAVAVAAIEAERDQTIAEIDRLAARRDAYAVERDSLARGVVVDLGSGDGVYARQRRDELAIRLAELDSASRRLTAERDALAARIGETRTALADRSRFAPVASAAGVVWRASPAPGAKVLAGDEILQIVDCERRFIEVAVSERHFEDIRPGRPALVRLRGGDAPFEAAVAAVRGSGGKFEHPQLAAETPEVAEGQLRVLIRLDPPPAATEAARRRLAASFCDVGRTAEVRFTRPLLEEVGGLAGAAERLLGAARDLAAAGAVRIALAPAVADEVDRP